MTEDSGKLQIPEPSLTYEQLSEQDKQFIEQLLKAMTTPIEDPASTTRYTCGFQPNPPEIEPEDVTQDQDNNSN